MQTKATVVEVNEQYAVVETERTSACDGCHKAAEGGCSVCSLMSSDRKIRTKAENKMITSFMRNNQNTKSQTTAHKDFADYFHSHKKIIQPANSCKQAGVF